jgi:hypothetical protein
MKISNAPAVKREAEEESGKKERENHIFVSPRFDAEGSSADSPAFIDL